VVQFIDHIDNAIISLVDFIGNLGRRFGWQEESSSPQGAQAPQQNLHQQASEQQNLPPVWQAPNQPAGLLPSANFNGNTPATLLDGPVPELIPIGSAILDPLGVGAVKKIILTGGDLR
jgi:hypothetical protein